MNAYGMFTGGMTPEQVHQAFEEGQVRRESAGTYNPTPSEAEALARTVQAWVARFEPQFEGDPPPALERIWRLPDDDFLAKSGVFHDTPRSYPRCIARAEFNGWWEDLHLTEDGRWLHRDDRMFGAWLPNIRYELKGQHGGFHVTGIIPHTRAYSNPAREACLQHWIDGTGFGTDPKTGWESIMRHPIRPGQEYLPWQFRIVDADDGRWKPELKG